MYIFIENLIGEYWGGAWEIGAWKPSKTLLDPEISNSQQRKEGIRVRVRERKE